MMSGAAVVGEAAGYLRAALPDFRAAVRQFPRHSHETTRHPAQFARALLGFHRTRQTNWDFALWVCAGSVVGALTVFCTRVSWKAIPRLRPSDHGSSEVRLRHCHQVHIPELLRLVEEPCCILIRFNAMTFEILLPAAMADYHWPSQIF